VARTTAPNTLRGLAETETSLAAVVCLSFLHWSTCFTVAKRK
jgi:hypothetical protein